MGSGSASQEHFFTVYIAAGAGKVCPGSSVDAIVHFDGVEHYLA